MTALHELLAEPFERDGPGRPQPHHVDLRESEPFPGQFHDETVTAEQDLQRAWAEFRADRDALARAISARYGPPRRGDIRRYFFDGDGSLDDPGGPLFRYMTDFFFDIDLWRAGDRGIVVEAGQDDPELPSS
ncbi:hypothetical protein [Paractinoplanes abujensis]|uniref:Uncharacterized protein n=1 Tax=Paractinoplanes abujensis TaxID=882441 RepID=A0A7W7CPJ5_9ACTN|nr:hypothetical protein [Actinoplanes abujensis]MBB4692356.1 hypothetical protein [Actinoplanes abujensis]